MKKAKNITILGLAATLSLGVLNSAVVVNSAFNNQYVPGSSDGSTVTGGVTSFTVPLADLTNAGFSATGSDKLVLSISTKWASNAGGAVTSLDYDGAAMTNAVAYTAQRAQDEVWYLDTVASDGDISLNFDSEIEGFAIYLFSLNGTKAGVQDTAAGNADTVMPDLTASTGGSFILWEVSGNRDNLSYSGTYSTAYERFGARGSSRALWNVEGAPGTFSETLDSGSNGGAEIGAVFEAVPEPGSFALLAGMFGLTWVMLRRRS